MAADGENNARPGLTIRQTASDRPGVAQPVPERDVPPLPWLGMLAAACALAVPLLAAWEGHWRAFGSAPGYYANDDSHWAAQRRRINRGEGSKTVLVGSSRTLFDIQLDVWEQATGERPIQLALEGTSGVLLLEDLAADPDFTGRLVVGVAPDLFFTGFAYRGQAVQYFHTEGPAKQLGHWLSQRMVEPYLGFYDPDFALADVVLRQDWPQRPGMAMPKPPIRKLMVQEIDRNSHMWSKLETDSDYRALARAAWASRLHSPPPPNLDTPAKRTALIDKQIARAVAAVSTLRARGVRLVFIRPPSIDDYYAFEQAALPRAQTWDVLLSRTGMAGIHFEDYSQLQSRDLPEWSHLSHAAARTYTAALVPLVQDKLR